MTRTAFGDVQQPDILFVPEVAEHLRRSVDSIRWLINTKQIKAAKLGGRVVVRRSDLEKFINDAFEDAS
ncbi:helix-turn-helix domain-containing protein [uncultured Microbacterium sp.]|uniref:helix-turn-helix domain-containing protein n=1 Tax=uncultured Microbacterium sp. TaxID=191216 RepID=UPI0025F2438C|nr:helix-turn-helix domain-containing protein [uncultured Microbacterium sp.]